MVCGQKFLFLKLMTFISLVTVTRCISNTGSTCGYESCPKTIPGMLNVHIISHSHDDVGWLKTVNQYYVGSNEHVQRASVVNILNSTVKELLKNPSRRFIYVEMEFFWRWWQDQNDITRENVKNLVKSGRLEMNGGAWSMNDEAVTHYQSTIDQFTWGFRRIKETVGECGYPRTAWQIDPFGHSREMASLLAQMGFDGLFIARLDYEDKRKRERTRTMEMIWEASNSLDASSNLFTSVLPDHYTPPQGLCFDILCNEIPINDDEHDPDYNADEVVERFIEFCKVHSKFYTTNNLIVTMGGDFYYQSARKWFVNLDKLIRNVNGRQKDGIRINTFYSTPSCYLKAVNDVDKTWPTKQDDFFPYASDEKSYWTGYYTSRPTQKYYERLGNNILQVGKQLEAMTELGQKNSSLLDSLREAMGIMQHHDAITGTAKQYVADDYARILSTGINATVHAIQNALWKVMTVPKATETKLELKLEPCLLLNISQCQISERSETFVVTIYNPLSRNVTHYMRLPVQNASYSVKDPSGQEILTQLVPIPKAVLDIPGRNSSAVNELVFEVANLPPLGYKSFFIKKEGPAEKILSSDDKQINNKNVHVDLDDSGLVRSIFINGNEIPLTQNFYYYLSTDSFWEDKTSGAYIFRPEIFEPVEISSDIEVAIYKGHHVQEIHQTFNEWVSQVIRIYSSDDHIEFEWLVGPIDRSGNIAREIVTKFTTEMKTSGLFFTDSNGRQIMKRKRDYQPTWEASITEPVAANYYPVTSMILIRDESDDMELAVLNDRAQGGTSMNDGEIEIMIHRRLSYDDGFGVDEVLSEMAFDKGLVARGRHYVVAGSMHATIPSLAVKERELALRKLLSPLVFLSETNDISHEIWNEMYYMEFSGLVKALPSNVHLLTLEPWDNNVILLRLEHILEKSDDPELSKPVSIDLKNLFSTFEIVSIYETTLGGNKETDKSRRLIWKIGSKYETLRKKRRRNTTLRGLVHRSAGNLNERVPVRNHVSRRNNYKYTNRKTENKEDESFHVYRSRNKRSANFESGRNKERVELNEDMLQEIELRPMEIRTFLVQVSQIPFRNPYPYY